MKDTGGTSRTVTWKSQDVVYAVEADYYNKNFQLADGTTWDHKVITNVTYSTKTLYYLGR